MSDIKAKKKNAWRENIEAILIAVVIAMFIRTFIVQAFKIPSGSMLETLQIGDQILVNKFIYGVKIPFTGGKTLIPVKDPKRGDIVVFEYPEDPSKDFIKRVIAVGGDTLEIRDKHIFVNDKEVAPEPYVIHKDSRVISGKFSPRDNLRKIQVPENKLFVMGDNRDNSKDSRAFGVVNRKQIVGQAKGVITSFDFNNKYLPRFGRFFDSIH